MPAQFPTMEKAFATAFATSPLRKAGARTALVNLKDSARSLLSECFRQFGIETVAMSANAAERLLTEKFEACVLTPDSGAETTMQGARSSPSTSRIVRYAVRRNA